MKYLNKLSKIILVLIFACVTLYIPKSDVVSAQTLGGLKQELSSIESKYNENQEKKKQTEEEIAATKAKVVKLSKEKEELQNEMLDLNNQIEELLVDIEDMQLEIKKIVNYYQLSSSSSMYLEYVFNASSFTDFIYRLAVSEQLSRYMSDTINEYNNLIEENKNKVSELASKQVALEKLQDEIAEQLTKLSSELSSINEEAVDITEEIEAIKKQINTYENTYKCSNDEELNTCIERYRRESNIAIPSAAGFYRPIESGALNYEYGYTAKYGAYHDGVDFSIPHGTKVYSVADGVVVKIMPRQSCGGNMVFIGHNVNGKTYTSLYAHLATIDVIEGQVVSYTTQIGTSGGVHSIEWWDSPSCSTGAHLHFQMATGIYLTDYYWYSSFTARSFNPRNVINFPSTDVRFYTR